MAMTAAVLCAGCDRPFGTKDLVQTITGEWLCGECLIPDSGEGGAVGYRTTRCPLCNGRLGLVWDPSTTPRPCLNCGARWHGDVRDGRED